MPNTKNIAVTKDLEEKHSKAKSVFLANYAGLTSKQQVRLRQEIKKAGGELIVAKNTLVSRLLGKSELDQSLQGQTGTVFAYEDEVAPLKALVAFAKEAESLKVKHGVVGDVVYDASALEELAKLPGKPEMIAMLLARLNAPGSKLVGVLTAAQRDLVYALQAIADKKKEAPAA